MKIMPRSFQILSPVTTKNKAKVVDYDILSNLPDNLYRLYEK